MNKIILFLFKREKYDRRASLSAKIVFRGEQRRKDSIISYCISKHQHLT